VSVRVGIDTGGTFTDLVAVDEQSGQWFTAKVPSDPDSPVRALAEVLRSARFDPREISSLVVGTTIGINAVLTRSGAQVVYLTTRGFEDVPHIQRINRKNHYDFHWRKPEPFALRRHCRGIDERTGATGTAERTPDGAQVAEAVADLPGDAAVAICFLFAYLNPESELAARSAVLAARPELPVSVSHEVAPVWREYERGTATILDAYIKPVVDRYVSGVDEALEDAEAGSRWSILKSNGGHALSERARERPSHMLLSGIAGGAIGGAFYARHRKAERAIVLDMGGTSCDICLIADGAPTFSSEFEIEFGLPLAAPSGGSIPAVSCRSGRRAPAPVRARRATAAVATRPLSPTPTSISAAWTPATSSAARSGSIRHSAAPRWSGWPFNSIPTPTPSQRRCCGSQERTWPTQCGWSPSTRASIRETTRSSRWAAPAPRTRRRSPTPSGSSA
jgi:N-methylhydantoinase A